LVGSAGRLGALGQRRRHDGGGDRNHRQRCRLPRQGQAGRAVTPSLDVVSTLVSLRLRVAVAESLTGGLLVAELINTPGASETVLGGVVAYNTELKRSILGVDASVLNVHGAVHPDVAVQMAVGVREVCAVDGTAAEVG